MPVPLYTIGASALEPVWLPPAPPPLPPPQALSINPHIKVHRYFIFDSLSEGLAENAGFAGAAMLVSRRISCLFHRHHLRRSSDTLTPPGELFTPRDACPRLLSGANLASFLR
jgi:hypothetical protein